MEKHIYGSTRKRAQKRSSPSHVSNQSRQSAKFSMAWLCGRWGWKWGDGSLIPASSKGTLENHHQLLMLHLFCSYRIRLRNKWDLLTRSACGVGDPAHTQHKHTVFWGSASSCLDSAQFCPRSSHFFTAGVTPHSTAEIYCMSSDIYETRSH